MNLSQSQQQKSKTGFPNEAPLGNPSNDQKQAMQMSPSVMNSKKQNQLWVDVWKEEG